MCFRFNAFVKLKFEAAWYCTIYLAALGSLKMSLQPRLRSRTIQKKCVHLQVKQYAWFFYATSRFCKIQNTIKHIFKQVTTSLSETRTNNQNVNTPMRKVLLFSLSLIGIVLFSGCSNSIDSNNKQSDKYIRNNLLETSKAYILTDKYQNEKKKYYFVVSMDRI